MLEYLLGNNVVVRSGKYEVPLQLFTEIMLGSIPYTSQFASRWMSRIATKWYAKSDLRDDKVASVQYLISLIYLSRLNTCSDPLDKLYALYPLIPDHILPQPVVDYSTIPQILYQSFVFETIQATGNFWISHIRPWISCAPFGSSTWALDLYNVEVAIHLILNIIFNPFESDPLNSTPGSNIQLDTSIGVSDRVLPLKGKRLGFVTALQTDDNHWSDPIVKLLNWFLWVIKEGCCYNKLDDGNPKACQHLRALTDMIFDLYLQGATDIRMREASEDFESVETHLQSLADYISTRNLYISTRKQMPAYWVLYNEATECTGLRDLLKKALKYPLPVTLFSLNNDYLGYTSDRMGVGDVVALLAGSDFPVILRPRGSEWEYVGAATWMNDIMSGEQWPKDTDLASMETFRLI